MNKHSRYIVIASLIVLVIGGGWFALMRLEQGFDDGPFYGKEFHGRIDTLTVSDSISCLGGTLIVINRDSVQSPIMALRDDHGDLEWALEMDVSSNPGFESCLLYRMANLRLDAGVLRTEIIFSGYWTFGGEKGRAYIWNLGKRFQKFYLSW